MGIILKKLVMHFSYAKLVVLSLSYVNWLNWNKYQAYLGSCRTC
jgi:hypothetical protein